MPTVSIGTMDKRINSTKQTFSSAFSSDCKLKEPCSMESPVFLVQGLSKGAFYNYASFEGRYFWVDDIIYQTNDIQEVHCHIDPLATYKDDIKNTFALVQYGDKSHWNKWVDDVRFNPEKEDTSLAEQQTLKFFNGSETGSIIMRVCDCSSAHGVRTIALTPASFGNILADLDLALSGYTMEKIATAIGGMGSWRDNILSCIWVPFDVAGSSSVSFAIGCINVTGTGSVVSPITRVNDQVPTIQIDWSWANNHPYLKNSRWTSYQLITPFGYCELPIEHLVNQSNIYITSSVVKTTGDIVIGVYEKGYGDGVLLASFAGNVSVDMMGLLGNGNTLGTGLANSMNFGAKIGVSAATLGMSLGAGQLAMTQAAQSVTDVGYKGANNGKLAGAFDNFERTQSSVNMNNFNAGVGAIASCVPSTTSVGAPGGTVSAGIANLWITGMFREGRLIRKVFTQVDKAGYGNFCDMYGYPCNQYMSLSTISGYVKCSGAIVEAEGASATSLANLNSMLNSGIYIE